jgi:hypothetical protein
MSHHSQNEVDVIIEGGSKSEQYIMGALISKALADAGYKKTEHHDKPNHVVDPLIHAVMYPSLLAIVRQNRPDFLNTPVIVSAYHAPEIPRERRAYDRVHVKALETALSQPDDDEDANPRGWTDRRKEAREDLIEV